MADPSKGAPRYNIEDALDELIVHMSALHLDWWLLLVANWRALGSPEPTLGDLTAADAARGDHYAFSRSPELGDAPTAL